MRVERLERRLCLSATVAFPGAEGFGKYAEGGRGGDVYYVSNLENDGLGSFRHGVDSADGPRTIVFDVAGTIFLDSDIWVDSPNITIAGETAPGDGVTLAGHRLLVVNSHDVIVRYIRSRPGDIHGSKSPTTLDSFGVYKSTDVILDHVSGSWAIDEVFAFNGPGNVTIQWSIASEGLHDSFHPDGVHSNGSLNYGGNLSLHHNLFVSNDVRNPKVTQNTDVVNNVAYNFGSAAIVGEFGGDDPRGPTAVNFEGNYYIAGPNTTSGTIYRTRMIRLYEEAEVWTNDNRVDFNLNGQLDGSTATDANIQFHDSDSSPQGVVVSERFEFPKVTTTDPLTAYEQVLASAGASLSRDPVDLRIVDKVMNQSGGLFIDSQSEVGGWPDLDPGTPRPDTDRDGMSDAWEYGQGLDPFDADDRNDDFDGNGYTELEEYLHALATGRVGDLAYSNVTNKALSESSATGSASGDFTQTHDSDDIFETISETVTATRRRGSSSSLDHTWEFDVDGGDFVTFFFEGYHDSTTEDVLLEYSTDEATWSTLLLVEKNADDDTFQTASLPADLAGDLYVRATDTVASDPSAATLYIDAMHIETRIGQITDNGGVDVDDESDGDGSGDTDGGSTGDGSGESGDTDGESTGDGSGESGDTDGDSTGDGSGESGDTDGDSTGDGAGESGDTDGDSTGDGSGESGDTDGDSTGDGAGESGDTDGDSNGDGSGESGDTDGDSNGDGAGESGDTDGDSNGDGSGESGGGEPTYTVVSSRAIDEATSAGRIATGDFSQTHSSDDAYELIQEHLVVARRSRSTFLNHTWEFNIPTGDTVEFFFEGYHNSLTEDIKLEFSTDNSVWSPLLTIENNSDASQSIDVPGNLAGTVFVRATDTDPYDSFVATLFVDEMRFDTSTGQQTDGGDTGDNSGGSGETDGGETDGGETGDNSGGNGETDGGETDGGDTGDNSGGNGETDGGETDGGETGDNSGGNGETDGGETDGGDTGDNSGGNGETDGGETDGGDTGDNSGGNGETDGGETDGGDTGDNSGGSGETGSGETGSGETGSGETDGGETDGGDTGDNSGGNGETDGGETDGGDTGDNSGGNGETDGGETDSGNSGDGGGTVLHATTESTTHGVRNGSLAEASTSNDSYETITERPSRRSIVLQHTWEFELAAGDHVFSVEAHLNADAVNTFAFEYFDGSSWIRMAEVTNKGVDETQTYNISDFAGGTILVRVVHAGTPTRSYPHSTIYIDEIAFRTP